MKADAEQSYEPCATEEVTLAADVIAFRRWADWYAEVMQCRGPLEVAGSEVRLEKISDLTSHEEALQGFSKNTALLMDVALDGISGGLGRA